MRLPIDPSATLAFCYLGNSCYWGALLEACGIIRPRLHKLPRREWVEMPVPPLDGPVTKMVGAPHAKTVGGFDGHQTGIVPCRIVSCRAPNEFR
jgi:hypothetical protein